MTACFFDDSNHVVMILVFGRLEVPGQDKLINICCFICRILLYRISDDIWEEIETSDLN